MYHCIFWTATVFIETAVDILELTIKYSKNYIYWNYAYKAIALSKLSFSLVMWAVPCVIALIVGLCLRDRRIVERAEHTNTM
jgi:hypothetical protein